MKNTKPKLVTMLLVIAASIAADAQIQVFVPANATGGFGNGIDKVVPLVRAVTLSGPGTITVTYLSGTVSGGNGIAGPAGINTYPSCIGWQFPLQEKWGVNTGDCAQSYALIGVYVAQSRVTKWGFRAVDGTKGLVRIGIMPNGLFLIGRSTTFVANQAGTLFLGINDMVIGDNSGGFTVRIGVQ